MKRFFLCILFSIPFFSYAQGIRGTITDRQGTVLPYTHVYVPELRKGTTANAEGHYRLELPDGAWKVEFRNLGYATLERAVLISGADVELDVVLDARTYRIGEVKVLSSGEDPAVYVMRRAIALSPYYKKQVSEYHSTVYLKGSGKIRSVPRLLRKTLEKQGVRTNDVYSVESLSKIHFMLPDRLRQEVLAQRTSGNDNNTSPMPMITSNLYSTADYGIVSPFDRQALQVYRFRLIDMFEDQGRMVNRIEVIPRRKGNDVFEGIINVFEGYWSVHSADLRLTAPMVSMRMKQLYGPVDVNNWMPVSLSFDVVFSGMGFNFDYVYVASLSDYRVTLNPALDHSFVEKQRLLMEEENKIAGNIGVIAPMPEINSSVRRSEKVQELLQKEELKPREAKRLNRLLDRETRQTTPPPPLEIEQRIFMDSVRVDRDSTFWEAIRPVPLTEGEISGFRRKDSLVAIQSTQHWRDSVNMARRRFKIQHLVMGSTYSYHPRGSTNRNTLTIPGIAGSDALSFNTVDGIKLNLPFRWHKRDSLGHAFSLSPQVGYGFTRKRADAVLSAQLTWNGAKKATSGFLAGTSTVDYNGTSGMPVFDNDFHTLWYERNHKKFYRSDYISVFQELEITNGLIMRSAVGWAHRQPLENHSEYRFIDWKNRSYTPNIPENATLYPAQLERNKLSHFKVNLTWTPRQRHYFRHGFKYYVPGTWPTFTLLFKQAVSGIFGSQADYSFIETGIGQRFGMGVGQQMEYKANAGWFLSHRSLHFSDFRHFATHRGWLYTSDPFSSFALNPFYGSATSRWFTDAYVTFQARRILVKHIPALAPTILSEHLFARFLHNDHIRYYLETGYALKNIFALFSLEAIASFHSGKFKSAGLKLGLNLPSLDQ